VTYNFLGHLVRVRDVINYLCTPWLYQNPSAYYSVSF